MIALNTRSILRTAVLVAVGIGIGCGVFKYMEYRSHPHPVYLSEISKLYDPQGGGVDGHITFDLTCSQPLATPPYVGVKLQYGRLWFDLNTKNGRLYAVKVELPTNENWRCPVAAPVAAPVEQSKPAVSQLKPTVKTKK